MNTKALLVVDVQEEYIQRYEDSLLKCINQRIKKALADSELIIYVKNIKIFSHRKKKHLLMDYTLRLLMFSVK